jgi:hypothetical protein
MSSPSGSPLQYSDSKSRGAADFYFAINATFRFILRRLGNDAWRRYLEEMGRDYFAPVNQRWREGGLPAIARYWRAFFDAEPDSRVEVIEHPDRVEVCVHECPAIKHLRAGKRELLAEYCQHCYHLGNARAGAAGFVMRLAGGNGSCRHTFAPAGAGLAPQAMEEIEEARS